MSMLVKNNKLEDSQLWQDCVAIAEHAYQAADELNEKEWSMSYKLKQRSFELTAAIADAEGSNSQRDVEWYYSQARTALFAVKNAYHVARKTDRFKASTEEMVELNKLIKRVEKEITGMHKAVEKLDAEDQKKARK